MANDLKQAVLWKPLDASQVKCTLCNWGCVISPNNYGRCSVRKNIDGILYSLNYDTVCAANADPIEKKPLFHFQPGTRSFSIAAPGCNFKCEFCQNWQISQVDLEEGQIEGQAIDPEVLVDAAIRSNCKSIAYTYTEPTIFMELCNDCGRLAKEKGLANVFVSNGFMTIEAIDFAKDWLNGINVDLKAFTEDYYKKLCKARLAPVLDTIKYIAKETDIWMEITTLIVPGQNDDPNELKKLADFIVAEAGPHVPWHISRFFPQYKYNHSTATTMSVIERAYEIGKKAGLRYIYPGNIAASEKEHTYCYNCGKMLIERFGYTIGKNDIKNGKCCGCNAVIDGYQL